MTHRTGADKGFTLIEIVIVLIIASILFVLATSAFSRFNKNQALGGSADSVLSVLAKARNQTLAGKDLYAYGVRLETDRVILFRGTPYDPATSTNETVLLSDLAFITDIALAGGGSDIYFERLSGKTSQSGTFRVALVSDENASTTITIMPAGTVEKN